MAEPLYTRDVAVRRIGLAEPGDDVHSRAVPVEAPIAFEVNGIGYAVMMGTPSDLTDFARGFALAEGLAADAGEIADIRVHAAAGGHVVRLTLPPDRAEIAFERARTRVSEGSCGLCGIDSIEAVLRPLPPVTARIATTRDAVARALDALWALQPLGRATGAAHAAAFCAPDGAIARVREDAGRHNALDKLIGALAADGIDPATGFILLSARCSYELVEKTVRANCPMLVTISAPTSLAVERAAAAGLTLAVLARGDSMLLVCDPRGCLR